VEGITFFRTATLMSNADDRLRLANAALQAADTLSRIAPGPIAGVS
jgi:hypothetical protein